MDWHYRHTLLTLCTLAFFGTMFARLVISPLVPTITAHFDITNAAIGTALSGMWLAYALTQFPRGSLAIGSASERSSLRRSVEPP